MKTLGSSWSIPWIRPWSDTEKSSMKDVLSVSSNFNLKLKQFQYLELLDNNVEFLAEAYLGPYQNACLGLI